MTERTTKPRQNANHSIKVAKQRYKSQVNQDQLPEVKIDENEEMQKAQAELDDFLLDSQKSNNDFPAQTEAAEYARNSQLNVVEESDAKRLSSISPTGQVQHQSNIINSVQNTDSIENEQVIEQGFNSRTLDDLDFSKIEKDRMGQEDASQAMVKCETDRNLPSGDKTQLLDRRQTEDQDDDGQDGDLRDLREEDNTLENGNAHDEYGEDFEED